MAQYLIEALDTDTGSYTSDHPIFQSGPIVESSEDAARETLAQMRAHFPEVEVRSVEVPRLVGLSSTTTAPPDLREEMSKLHREGTSFSLFRLHTVDTNRGYLLWVPSAGRAGLVTNGDTQWTDATSPEDAVRRYLADEMQP